MLFRSKAGVSFPLHTATRTVSVPRINCQEVSDNSIFPWDARRKLFTNSHVHEPFDSERFPLLSPRKTGSSCYKGQLLGRHNFVVRDWPRRSVIDLHLFRSRDALCRRDRW
jgi:hypothetical protein